GIWRLGGLHRPGGLCHHPFHVQSAGIPGGCRGAASSGRAGAESIPAPHEITQHYARLFGLKLLPFGIAGIKSVYHLQGRRIEPAANTEWPFALTEEERKLGAAGLRKKYFDKAWRRRRGGLGEGPGEGTGSVGRVPAGGVAAGERCVGG